MLWRMFSIWTSVSLVVICREIAAGLIPNYHCPCPCSFGEVDWSVLQCDCPCDASRVLSVTSLQMTLSPDIQRGLWAPSLVFLDWPTRIDIRGSPIRNPKIRWVYQLWILEASFPQFYLTLVGEGLSPLHAIKCIGNAVILLLKWALKILLFRLNSWSEVILFASTWSSLIISGSPCRARRAFCNNVRSASASSNTPRIPELESAMPWFEIAVPFALQLKLHKASPSPQFLFSTVLPSTVFKNLIVVLKLKLIVGFMLPLHGGQGTAVLRLSRQSIDFVF